MQALRLLVQKDILLFLADRKGAVLTLVTPVVLAALLGMLFAPRPKAKTIRILVVTHDGSPAVERLIKAINANKSLNVVRSSESDARQRLARGHAPLALIIPRGSGDALKPASMFGSKTGGKVLLLYDPSRQIERNIAVGLLHQVMFEQVAQQFGDPKALESMFGTLLSDLNQQKKPDLELLVMRQFLQTGVTLARTQKKLAGSGKKRGLSGKVLEPPLKIQSQVVEAEGVRANYNSYAHNFSGMLCMFLLFFGVEAARGLLAERDRGTLVRLRMAPARPAVILGATALSALLIAVGISIAVYAVGISVFGIRVRGSWIGFVMVLVAQAAFVGGFALLLAGTTSSDKQLGNIGAFTVLVMSFAGGATLPSFMMPEWLQAISQILPTTWATRGLAAMTWRGLPFESAITPTLVLLGFAGGAALLGASRFQWR